MVIEYPYKGDDGRWYKPCHKCGDMQNYLRYSYALSSLNLNKLCKKCSNRITENCHRGWHREIRISWFNRFKNSADSRKINFNITIDDVADLMIKQNYKCALTGRDIKFPETGVMTNFDASIDRINSNKGYDLDNIQLTHKLINMIKNKYDNDFFIDICKEVASYDHYKKT
jgi:hypothetical protein